MKTLILLRHAKSSRDDDRFDDHERPLAPRGVQDCEPVGRWLAASTPLPELVLCSSARRARATLEGILPHLPTEPPVRIERSLYLATPGEMLEALAEVGDEVGTVLIVGHNPGIQVLAADLAVDGDATALKQLQEQFPTAALASIRLPVERWRDVELDSGRLLHYVTPRSLEAATS